MGSKRNGFWKIALPVLTALLGWASIGLGQPEEIVFDKAGMFQHKQRSAVTFQHEKHMEGLECLSCHHQYENGENVLDEGTLEEGAENITCASCHGAESDIDLKQAFHRQCMGCHMKLRKQKKNTGPELCGECHLKE